MATGTFAAAVTKTTVVEVEEATHTLVLNDREAQILHCLLSFTRDTDPNFPEIKDMLRALRAAHAPEYYGILRVADSDGRNDAHVSVRER
jgi:hypothetical protein